MKQFRIEIKWGIIFTIVGLLWMWFEKLVGLHDVYVSQHPLYTNVFGIFAVAMFVLALLEKRRKFYNGKMSWREGFVSGIVVTIVITLLSPLSQYIVNTYISPRYFGNIIEYTVESNKMTREQAEGYYNMRSYIIQATFGALVMGVVTSAIVAWILQTKKEGELR